MIFQIDYKKKQGDIYFNFLFKIENIYYYFFQNYSLINIKVRVKKVLRLAPVKSI